MVERDGGWVSSSTDEDHALLRVTRRGFIAGSVASAFVSDSVFGAEVTDQKNRWVYSRSEDGSDRYIYKFTYFDGAGQAKLTCIFVNASLGCAPGSRSDPQAL